MLSHPVGQEYFLSSGNTTGICTHTENVFYLFTDAQCTVHFIHYISYPVTPLPLYSSPEKAVYTVSRKSRIQFIVTTWQDVHDEKILYQFCHLVFLQQIPTEDKWLPKSEFITLWRYPVKYQRDVIEVGRKEEELPAQVLDRKIIQRGVVKLEAKIGNKQ